MEAAIASLGTSSARKGPGPRVFLSYSRKDAADAAAFRADLADAGCTVHLDVEAIAIGEKWRERILKLITVSEYLVFLMSPASLASEECTKELQIAREMGKSIIPVDVAETPLSEAPDWIRSLNVLQARNVAERAEQIPRLAARLRVPLDWERQKADIAERARLWEAGGRAPHLLELNDRRIRSFEKWLTELPDRATPPIALHREFIFESRSRQRRLRRLRNSAIAVTMALIAGTAAVAWLQREEAARQRTERLQNESRVFAGLAGDLAAEDDYVGAMRLALAGLPHPVERPDRPVVPEARRALHAALHANRQTFCMALPALPEAISAMALSPKEGALAAVASGGDITLWNLPKRSGTLLRGDAYVWTSLDFSPDGRRIAAVSELGEIALFDAATGQEAEQPTPEGLDRLTFVRFDRGGDRLVMVSEGRDSDRVLVWTLSDGAVRGVRDVGDYVRTAVFDPTGAGLLVAGDADAILLEKDGAGGFRRARIFAEPGDPPAMADFAAFDPAGEHVVVSRGRSISIFDAATGGKLAGLNGWDAITAVSFTPDGEEIVVLGRPAEGDVDGLALVWNWDKDQVTARLVAEKDTLCGDGGADTRSARAGNAMPYHVVFGPEGGSLLTAYGDGRVRGWALGPRPPPRTLPEAAPSEARIAFDSAGEWVVAGPLHVPDLAHAREIGVWRKGRAPLRKELGGGTIANVALGGDGSRLAVLLAGQEGRRVEVLDKGLDPVASLPDLPPTTTRIALDSGGERLALASDGGVEIRSVVTGSLVARHCQARGDMLRMAFTPDGESLVGLFVDGTVLLWDAAIETPVDACDPVGAAGAGAGLRLCMDGAPVNDVAAGPGGLIACQQGASVRILNADRPEAPPVRLPTPVDPVTAIAFDRTGERIVGASRGRASDSLHIWETGTGYELTSLPHEMPWRLARAIFSPDGHDVLTLDLGSNLALWPTHTDLASLIGAAMRAIPGCENPGATEGAPPDCSYDAAATP